MTKKNFELIYQTLLQVAQRSVFFDEERRLAWLAQQALASMDAQKMLLALIEISFGQYFHTGAQEIAATGQEVIKTLLLSAEFQEKL